MSKEQHQLYIKSSHHNQQEKKKKDYTAEQ